MSNNRLHIRITLTLLASLLFADAGESLSAREAVSEERPSITWETVANAVRYEVRIRDEKGTVVHKETVSSPLIVFSLEPGRYYINIVAINKFNKPHSESGWEEFEVVKRQAHRRLSEGTLIHMAAGPHFSIPVGDWKRNLHPTIGGSLRLGLTGTSSPTRYGGIEADIRALKYSGFDDVSSLTSLMLGSAIYGRIPIGPNTALLARGGGGLALSRLRQEAETGEDTTSRMSGLFWKAGLSLEYRLPRGYFIEGGLETRTLLFPDVPLVSIDGFFSGGICFNWEPEEKRREKLNQESSAFLPVVFRISAGIPYVILSPDPVYIKDRTYEGIDVGLAIQGMKGFWRFTGLALDFTFAEFEGKDFLKRARLYMSGPSLLFTTDFAFPINLLFKAGLGNATARLDYHEQSSPGTKTEWRETIYYTAAAGLEIRVYSGFFLETSGGYYFIPSNEVNEKIAKFSLRAGIRL